MLKAISIKSKEFDNVSFDYFRFNEESELLDYIGVYFSSHRKYFNDRLSNFLENVGSEYVVNIDDIPKYSFEFDLDKVEYEIGVTHTEVERDRYEYYYWVMDSYVKDYNEGYRFKLMDYLEEMDFSLLPNYNFKNSFDEMIQTSNYEEIEKLEEYSKYCLENKGVLIEMNKDRVRELLDKSILTLEELEELEQSDRVTNFESNGISGLHIGYNWYTVTVDNEEFDVYSK